MKNLLFTLLLYSCATVAFAQSPLVITRENFNITASTDTLFDVGNLDGILKPVEGSNKNWDYSNLDTSIKTIQTLICKNPVEPFFSTSTCWFQDLFEILAGERGFYYDDYSTLGDNSYSFVGIGLKEQKYYIGDLTNNPTDSIIFPKQNLKFDNPRIVMNFPSTFGTVTKSVFTKSVEFQLSILLFGLDHGACKKITHVTQVDSVVGWGTVVVPNLSSPNGKSQPYNVLLVKRYYTTVDSLYLNGSPAPMALLSAFSLQQGYTQNTFRYMFWRENSKIPLLTLNYGNTKFIDIQSAIFDLSTDISTSVDDFDSESIVSNVYPNPTTGVVTIEMPQLNDLNLSITISDINGNTLLNKDLSNLYLDNKYNIKLPDNIIDGTYLYQVKDFSGKIITKGKFVVSK